ncbi:hypothetical protein [Halobacillus massiliensis]|uniref:hypothetical protein n=1 Tax=Halobacillus massiliensis TaxID=1926286 RepID=UPI0015C4934F|nr:hypothetical protein [Halobacillus massiliensis]
MYYLLFALFFSLFLVAGYVTPLNLSSTGAALAIAFIIANLYMFVKDRRNKKSRD